jgi:hypothetical protein
MKRLGRWLVHSLVVLSLLLCLAIIVLWVRSYTVVDDLALARGRSYEICSDSGVLHVGVTSTFVGTVISETSRSITIYGPRREHCRLTLSHHNWWCPSTAAKLGGMTTFGVRTGPTGIIIDTDRGTWIEAFRALLFPHWCAAVVFGILPSMWLVRWRRRRRYRAAGECRQCGYNLTGNLSGFCPECGTAIGEVGRGQ